MDRVFIMTFAKSRLFVWVSGERESFRMIREMGEERIWDDRRDDREDCDKNFFKSMPASPGQKWEKRDSFPLYSRDHHQGRDVFWKEARKMCAVYERGVQNIHSKEAQKFHLHVTTIDTLFSSSHSVSNSSTLLLAHRRLVPGRWIWRLRREMVFHVWTS